ncbi:hypothetical protein CRUP_019658, partial [Coryphaenoides rupestris]
GRVSFVAAREGEEPENSHVGEDVFRPYEVCFSVEIRSKPPPPLGILNVQSSVLGSTVVLLAVPNPRGEEPEVGVTLEGEGLSGEQRVTAPPRGTLDYRVTFAPIREGHATGRVVFQSECLGELWYQLELVAVSPPPSTLTPTHCQLGRWVRQTIVLENPTAESLELTVSNSNPRNFTLEMDRRSTVTVASQSRTQLGVRFRPSFLGDHRAQITFSCPQPVSHRRDQQVFWVALRRTQGLLIGPGVGYDIPVVFAPASMEVQQAWLYITLRPLPQGSARLAVDEVAGALVAGVRWAYPLRGVPTAPAAVCPAGGCREEPLEVQLTGGISAPGVVPNPRGEEPEVGVTLEGEGLSGEQRVTAPPRGTLDYRVTFAPIREGHATGRVSVRRLRLGTHSSVWVTWPA